MRTREAAQWLRAQVERLLTVQRQFSFGGAPIRPVQATFLRVASGLLARPTPGQPRRPPAITVMRPRGRDVSSRCSRVKLLFRRSRRPATCVLGGLEAAAFGTAAGPRRAVRSRPRAADACKPEWPDAHLPPATSTRGRRRAFRPYVAPRRCNSANADQQASKLGPAGTTWCGSVPTHAISTQQRWAGDADGSRGQIRTGALLIFTLLTAT